MGNKLLNRQIDNYFDACEDEMIDKDFAKVFVFFAFALGIIVGAVL